MGLRPELDISRTISRFPPKLAGEIIYSLYMGNKRDLYEDSNRIRMKNKIQIFGQENLNHIGNASVFIVFNQPVTPVLVEGIFTLLAILSDDDIAGRKDITLIAAGEIPSKKNAYFPWSISFMKKLAYIYNINDDETTRILLVPNNKLRPDYREGRKKVNSAIRSQLARGGIVALAGEGDWGENINQTKKDSDLRHGAGQIAIDTVETFGGKVLPVAIAVSLNGMPYLQIGEPLIPRSSDKKDVSLQIAESIKAMLPKEMVVR